MAEQAYEAREFVYVLRDDPKSLRETLCIAQQALNHRPLDEHRKPADRLRLQRLIDACDELRPLGPDGKHGDRHTPFCGCDRD